MYRASPSPQSRFDSIFNSFSRPFNVKALFNLSPVSPQVQSHLIRVYTLLSVALLCAAVGAYLHVRMNIGGLITTLMGVGALMWLLFDQGKSKLETRCGAVAFFALCKGASIGPLIHAALFMDPSVLVTAFMGTTAIFVSFSAAAYFAKRREFLFLGGILSSAVSMMFLLSFVNIFVRSSGLMNFQLYLGLLVFSAYVVYDTQMIIEKASLGDYDFVWHTVELFIDFVAVFVRLLIILMNNKKKDNENDRRRRQ